jgi:hypothetical protein
MNHNKFYFASRLTKCQLCLKQNGRDRRNIRVHEETPHLPNLQDESVPAWRLLLIEWWKEAAHASCSVKLEVVSSLLTRERETNRSQERFGYKSGSSIKLQI